MFCLNRARATVAGVAGVLVLSSTAGAQPVDPLATRMTQVARAVAPGMRPASPWASARLAPFRAQAGRCYALVGVGEPSVTDLDVLVFDTHKHRVAADIAANSTPIVHLCAKQSETWIGETRVRKGVGVARAQWFAANAEFDKLLDEDLGLRVEALSPGAAQVGALKTVSLHRIATVEVPIRMGECYVVAAVATAGISQLWLSLLDPQDRVVRAARTDRPTAEVEYCPEKKGAHRVTLRAFTGEGDARVGVYRRRID